MCAVFLLAAAFLGGWVYLVWYMPTDILVSESEDGAYRVTVRRIGEPEANIYHAAYLRILVERSDGMLLDRRDVLLLEGDVSFRAQDCQVNWYPAGVAIRFEQPFLEYSPEYSTVLSLDDLLYIPGWSKPHAWSEPWSKEPDVWTVTFDGSDVFLGYTQEQALELMQERYGSEIWLVEEEDGDFLFSAGDVEFHAVNDIALTDDFWERYTEYWAKGFSASHNRWVILDREEESEPEWVPTLSFSGRSGGEIERFARAACDLIESFMENPYLSPDGRMPVKLCYSAYGEELSVSFGNVSGVYDRASIYNMIYTHVEENSLRVYEQRLKKKQSEEQDEDEGGSALFQGVELTDEIWERYLSIEPECFYIRPDGMELRLTAIDRALGSSFYILIAVSGDESEYEVINWDPYMGHGGQAMWIGFPEDDGVGFIGLAYSGGAYGMLFRTEDGGRTFSECEYPSANVELPDGELYNPFVMPEKVFAEGATYYLLAGQGPNGDYYGEEGYCKGLYCSSDRGKTWKYLGEVPGVDMNLSELYEG